MTEIFPKISIITPSYNQGEFIEETILSVLGQNYPNLEYIIIDGGSTDNTVEIIRKYENQLAYWISEKDEGQSHAINKGFEKATGHILGWLNSDDMYMPNILSVVADNFNNNFDGLLLGESLHFRNEDDGVSSYGSGVLRYANSTTLQLADFIIQPSTFWSKNIWEIVGKLDQTSHFGFDWEWFLRAQKLNVKFKFVTKPLSIYRIHKNHKSGTGGLKRQLELLKIYKLYDPNFGAVLYHKLMTEELKQKNFIVRLLAKFFWIFNIQNSFAKILKILKPLKYKSYTSNEIQIVSTML